MITTHIGQEIPPELAAAFQSIEAGDIKEAHLGGQRWERLQLWHARGYRAWPNPRSAAIRFAKSADEPFTR